MSARTSSPPMRFPCEGCGDPVFASSMTTVAGRALCAGCAFAIQTEELRQAVEADGGQLFWAPDKSSEES